jgi:hypothetical protein
MSFLHLDTLTTIPPHALCDSLPHCAVCWRCTRVLCLSPVHPSVVLSSRIDAFIFARVDPARRVADVPLCFASLFLLVATTMSGQRVCFEFQKSGECKFADKCRVCRSPLFPFRVSCDSLTDCTVCLFACLLVCLLFSLLTPKLLRLRLALPLRLRPLRLLRRRRPTPRRTALRRVRALRAAVAAARAADAVVAAALRRVVLLA